MILRAAPWMDLALLRKKPVVRMRASSWGRVALAMAAGVGKRLEELRGHHVDANVGALGGEDGGDEEFPGGAMGEGALDVGVGFVEGFEDGGDAVGGEVAALGLLLCGGLAGGF